MTRKSSHNDGGEGGSEPTPVSSPPSSPSAVAAGHSDVDVPAPAPSQTLQPGEKAVYVLQLDAEPRFVDPNETSFKGEIFAPGFGYSLNDKRYAVNTLPENPAPTDEGVAALNIQEAFDLLWEHDVDQGNPRELNTARLKAQYYKACADYRNQSESKQRELKRAYEILLASLNERFIQDNDHLDNDSLAFLKAKMDQVVAFLKQDVLTNIDIDYGCIDQYGRPTWPQVFYSKNEAGELQVEYLSFPVNLKFQSNTPIPAIVTVDKENKVIIASDQPPELRESANISSEKLFVEDLDVMRMEALREYIVFVAKGNRGWSFSTKGFSRFFDDFGKQPLSEALVNECPTYVYLQTHQLGLYPSWMSRHVAQIDALLAERGFVEGTREIVKQLVEQLRDSVKALLRDKRFSKALYKLAKQHYEDFDEQKVIHSLVAAFNRALYYDVFRREYGDGKAEDAKSREYVVNEYLPKELASKFITYKRPKSSESSDSPSPSSPEDTAGLSEEDATDFSDAAFSQLDKVVADFDNANSEEEVTRDLLAAWDKVLERRSAAMMFDPQEKLALIEFCSEHKLLEYPQATEQLFILRESKSTRESIYRTIMANEPVSMVSLAAYTDFTMGSSIRNSIRAYLIDKLNIKADEESNKASNEESGEESNEESGRASFPECWDKKQYELGRIPKFEDLPQKLQRNKKIVRQYQALAWIETVKERAKQVDHSEIPGSHMTFRKDVDVALRAIKTCLNPKITLSASSGRPVVYSKLLRDKVTERLDAIFEIHDNSASALTKRWRSFRAKLPFSNAESLKRKRKEKFLAKHKAFFPKGDEDLHQKMLAEIKRIRDSAAREILAAKSLEAILKTAEKAILQIQLVDDDAEIKLNNPQAQAQAQARARARTQAISDINHMRELCKMSFDEAQAYYDRQSQTATDRENIETYREHWLSKANDCYRWLSRANNRYKKFPEHLRDKFTDIKEAIDQQINDRRQQEEDSNASQDVSLERQQALWRDIQDAIEMDMDAPLLVDALSKLALILRYPSEGFEEKLNALLELIPEEQRLRLTTHDIAERKGQIVAHDVDKLLRIRNALDHVIQHLPVDHEKFSEDRRLNAKAMMGLLDAIIEKHTVGEYKTHNQLDSHVLEHFDYPVMGLTIEGYGHFKPSLERRAEDVSYGSVSRETSSIRTDDYLGMSSADKACYRAFPNEDKAKDKAFNAALKSKVAQALLSRSDASDPEVTVTSMVELIRQQAEALNVDTSVSHKLTYSNSTQGYSDFDILDMRLVRPEFFDRNPVATARFLQTLETHFQALRFNGSNGASCISALKIKGLEALIPTVKNVTNVLRALPDGTLQHEKTDYVESFMLTPRGASSDTVARKDGKPLALIKKVFHIVPAEGDGEPEVRLVGYRFYALHPLAEPFRELVDAVWTPFSEEDASRVKPVIIPGKKKFKASPAQFDKSGVFEPCNFEKALLDRLKAAAIRYLKKKGYNPDNTDTNNIIARSRGHKATYQACLVFRIITKLEANKDILTAADYQAAIRTMASIHDQVSTRSRLRIMLRTELGSSVGKDAIAKTSTFSYAIGHLVGNIESELHRAKQAAKRFRMFRNTRPLRDEDSVVADKRTQLQNEDSVVADERTQLWLSSMVDIGWAYLNRLGPEASESTISNKLDQIAELVPAEQRYVDRQGIVNFMVGVFKEIEKVKTLLENAKDDPDATTFDDLKAAVEAIERDVQALCDNTKAERASDDASIINRIQADALRRINFEFQSFKNHQKLKYNARLAGIVGIASDQMVRVNAESKKRIGRLLEEHRIDAVEGIKAEVQRARDDILAIKSQAETNLGSVLPRLCDPVHVQQRHKHHHQEEITSATTKTLNILIENVSTVISKLIIQRADSAKRAVEAPSLELEAVQQEIKSARERIAELLTGAEAAMDIISEEACKKTKKDCLERLKGSSRAQGDFKELLKREIRAVTNSEVEQISNCTDEDDLEYLASTQKLFRLLKEENSYLPIDVAEEALKETGCLQTILTKQIEKLVAFDIVRMQEECDSEGKVEELLNETFKVLNNLLEENLDFLSITIMGKVVEKAFEDLVEAADTKIASFEDADADADAGAGVGAGGEGSDDSSDDETRLTATGGGNISPDNLRKRITTVSEFWEKAIDSRLGTFDSPVAILQLAQNQMNALSTSTNETITTAKQKAIEVLVRRALDKMIADYQSSVDQYNKKLPNQKLVEMAQCVKAVAAAFKQFNLPDTVAKEIFQKLLNELLVKNILLIEVNTSVTALEKLNASIKSLLDVIEDSGIKKGFKSLVKRLSVFRKKLKDELADRKKQQKPDDESLVQNVSEKLKLNLDPREIEIIENALQEKGSALCATEALDEIVNTNSSPDNYVATLRAQIEDLANAVTELIQATPSVKVANAAEHAADQFFHDARIAIRSRIEKRKNLSKEQTRQLRKLIVRPFDEAVESSQKIIARVLVDKNKAVYAAQLAEISQQPTADHTAMTDYIAIPPLEAYEQEVFENRWRGSADARKMLDLRALNLRQKRVNREVKTLSELQITDPRLQELQRAAIKHLIEEQQSYYSSIDTKAYVAPKKNEILEPRYDFIKFMKFMKFIFINLDLMTKGLATLEIPPSNYSNLKANQTSVSNLEANRTSVLSLMFASALVSAVKAADACIAAIKEDSDIADDKKLGKIADVVLTTIDWMHSRAYFDSEAARSSLGSAISGLMTQDRATAILERVTAGDLRLIYGVSSIFKDGVEDCRSHIDVRSRIRILLSWSQINIQKLSKVRRETLKTFVEGITQVLGESIPEAEVLISFLKTNDSELSLKEMLRTLRRFLEGIRQTLNTALPEETRKRVSTEFLELLKTIAQGFSVTLSEETINVETLLERILEVIKPIQRKLNKNKAPSEKDLKTLTSVLKGTREPLVEFLEELGASLNITPPEEMKENLADKLYQAIEISAFWHGLEEKKGEVNFFEGRRYLEMTRLSQWRFLEPNKRRAAITEYANYFVGIPEGKKRELINEVFGRIAGVDKNTKTFNARQVLEDRDNLYGWAMMFNEAQQSGVVAADAAAVLPGGEGGSGDTDDEDDATDASGDALEAIKSKIRFILVSHGLPKNHELLDATMDKVKLHARQLARASLASASSTSSTSSDASSDDGAATDTAAATSAASPASSPSAAGNPNGIFSPGGQAATKRVRFNLPDSEVMDSEVMPPSTTTPAS